MVFRSNSPSPTNISISLMMYIYNIFIYMYMFTDTKVTQIINGLGIHSIVTYKTGYHMISYLEVKFTSQHLQRVLFSPEFSSCPGGKDKTVI